MCTPSLSARREIENERPNYSLDNWQTPPPPVIWEVGGNPWATETCCFQLFQVHLPHCSHFCHSSAFSSGLPLSNALLRAPRNGSKSSPSQPAVSESVMATHLTHSSANRRFNKIPSLSNSVFIKFPPNPPPTHINSSSLPFRTNN